MCQAHAISCASPEKSVEIHLRLRKRVRLFHGREIWLAAEFKHRVSTQKMAMIITDMWDQHWCKSATTRVGQIARIMEPLLVKARAAGILIIHAPSETMNYYANSQGRRFAIEAPHAVRPIELDIEYPPLPIDDSDDGCDCDTPGEVAHRAWSRETELLSLAPGDVISDDGAEIYNVLKHRNIDTVLFTGVHANMCVLNRSFGIRQLSKWGIPCVLVRDLTDAMYNPARKPYVSHAAGTELVIEYIEKYWAPSLTSQDILTALAEGI